MMRLLYAFCLRFLGPFVAVWVRGIELRAQAAELLAGRGEVAEAPERPDEYAAGLRIYLTDERIDAAIADLDQQFPKTKDRRIR